MNLSAFHNPTVHPGRQLAPSAEVMAVLKPILITPQADGVTLIEEVKPKPQPVQTLVFSDFDQQTRCYTATLSPKQTKQLTDAVCKELGISVPFLDISVQKTPSGNLYIVFAIHPRLMHGQTIYPINHPGLDILFVSGIRLAFGWQVEKQEYFPIWLK